VNNTFKFILPADIEKGADGEWKVRGLASSERIDQQGETIMQKGIDLTPIDKKRGVLNWDHCKGPENTIGVLDGYTRTPRGLFIEGRLFKNHSKAKAVREIMESLGESDRGRIGLSVEGKITERDPNNPAVIRKCQINAVALTMNPVNTDTFADIVKSMNAAQEVEFDVQEQNIIDAPIDEPVFTAMQVMAIVQKALSVGAGSMGPTADKVGGDALQPSDMTPIKEEKKKIKKKKMKRMDKCMYKSNLITILDKLQILYPTHSRSEIWEAVKDRLDTKFDMEKGGQGSGVRGHKKIGPINEHLSDYRSKNVHLSREQHRAKAKELRSMDGSPKYKESMAELASFHESEASAGIKKSEELDVEKGIRLKNISGKEREHKLYEDARQREDYERNKDKSRSELNQLAEESGASKHDKAKIRAQKDAAIQVGERDHVRPNVKG
jgi:hypothetical protein